MSEPHLPSTWRDACADFVAREGADGIALEPLEAFVSPQPRGGPPPPPEMPWSEGFEALEHHFADALDGDGLARQLSEELGGVQPAMFARRIAATETILRELGTSEARVLRVGLRVRLDRMQAAPPPRAHRVRALADFYYSLAARLRHPEWAVGHGHLETLVAAAAWRTVAEGVLHATLDGTADGMPTHVNLLRIDPSQVRFRVKNLYASTAEGATFGDAAGPAAVAAVSGGFFLYSEDDVVPPSARHDPVGLLLEDGVLASPPVFRRASLLVDAEGRVDIRRVGLDDVTIHAGDAALVASTCVNRASAERGPAAPSVAVVGERIVAVGTSLAVPLNGFVAGVSETALERLRPGDEVTYGVPAVRGGGPAVDGISGGPLIVDGGEHVLDMQGEDFWGSAPPITFSQDETGDRNLLARLAAGLDANGQVFFAAVDGRNVERALGMTLGDVARLMVLLGCVRATNLDGGSSKRMLVDGEVVDLESTEIVTGETSVVGTRPVHTAIVIEAR